MQNTIEVIKEREVESNILKYCNAICGVREEMKLGIAIEEKLPDCLEFENACALFFQNNRLFTVKCFKNDSGEYTAEGLMEIPSSVGLTGKAIKNNERVISV